MTAEQHACEQHFITHTTQQQDGGFVARLPTKEELKQIESSRLSSERRLHAMERRLEQELKDLYHYFVKKCEQLGQMEPVKSQEGNNHVTFYHFVQSSRKQEQDHPRATNRSHSEHKTKGASHNSIHICSYRNAQFSCHCQQDIPTENVARQTAM